MTEFRPFTNRDTPDIVAIWNRQAPLRGRLSPLTATLFEQYVLAKPYFDPQGLIVADGAGRPVGFVHAGFAAGHRSGELLTEAGVICQLLVEPSVESPGRVAGGLLRQGEEYLRVRGAREFLGGAAGCTGPFYLGMYGGSNLPGVLAGDVTLASALREAGYTAFRERIVLERHLGDFRPPVDRQFLQLRRQFRLEAMPDSDQLGWNDACTWCWAEREHFAVVPLAGGEARATFEFWNIEPLGQSLGVRAIGLLQVTSQETLPSDFIACFLGEAMREFHGQGVSFVEAQVSPEDTSLLSGCQRLGFREVDRGTQYRRELGAARQR